MDIVEFISSYRIIPREIHTLLKRRKSWLRNNLFNPTAVNFPYDVLHTYNPNFAIEAYLLSSLYAEDKTLENSNSEYVFAAAAMFAGIQLRLRANSNQQLDSTECMYLLADRPSLSSISRIVRALDNTHLLLHLTGEHQSNTDLSTGYLINEICTLFCDRTKRGVNQFLLSSIENGKVTPPEVVYLKSGEPLDGMRIISRRQIGSLVAYRLGSPSRYITAFENLTQGKRSSQMSIILFDKQEVICDLVSIFSNIANLSNICIKMLHYQQLKSDSIDCLLVANTSLYPVNFRKDFNLGNF